jgi:hypothetical protein
MDDMDDMGFGQDAGSDGKRFPRLNISMLARLSEGKFIDGRATGGLPLHARIVCPLIFTPFGPGRYL